VFAADDDSDTDAEITARGPSIVYPPVDAAESDEVDTEIVSPITVPATGLITATIDKRIRCPAGTLDPTRYVIELPSAEPDTGYHEYSDCPVVASSTLAY
jgi:hypothetical protein